MLKMKSSPEFSAYISESGLLCIKQPNFETGKDVVIYMSPDQVIHLEDFIFHSRDEAIDKWNNGVDDE